VIFSGFFAWKMMQNEKIGTEKDSPAPVVNQNNREKEGLKKVKVGEKELWVEILETGIQKTKGLSGKEELAEDVGFLFVYEKPEAVNFWMKDMLFLIDIIWIANDKIVGIEEGVSPPLPGTLDKDLAIYRSPKPVNYVLETNAGWCKKNNIKIDDVFSFK